MLDWIEPEAVGLFSPDFADEFIGRQALQHLQSRGEVISHQKGLQVVLQLVMRLVVAFYRGLFDGSTHTL